MYHHRARRACKTSAIDRTSTGRHDHGRGQEARRADAVTRGRLDARRQDYAARKRGAGALTLSVALLALLSGCSDSLPSLPKVSELNPFKEKIPPLPGKRIPVMPVQEKSAASWPTALLGSSSRRRASTKAGRSRAANPTTPPEILSSLALSSRPGARTPAKGRAKPARVVASPIVYDGRVYALDAQGNVSAFAINGGSAAWRVSLAPDSSNKGSGFSASSLFSLGGGDDGGAYGGSGR